MADAGAPLELGRLYQLGYVTSDMERAMDYAQASFGVREFIDFGEIDNSVADGVARVRVAQGLAGDLVFELIEPRGGDDALYADYLPAGRFAVRLHHTAYHLDDADAWRRLNAAVQAQGVPVALSGASSNSQYVYLDLREQLGHYAEVVHRLGAAAGLDVQGERRRVAAAIAGLNAARQGLSTETVAS